jgi:hypothetical protein
MANQVMNFARGKIGYYMADALGLAGANSRAVVVVLQVAEADDTLNNYDDLGALLGGSNTEAASTGYARKQIAAAGVTTSINDGANTAQAEIDADQTWTSVSQAASEAWVKLLVAYDADNTAGTDANIVVLTHHDFSVTPNGGDITADFAPQFWVSS